MKKKILRVLIGVVALLVLAIGGLVTKFYILSPKSRPAPVVRAPGDPATIAKGKYLANNVMACMGCHSQVSEDKPGEPPVEGKLGSGRDFGDLGGKVPFHLRSANLTPNTSFGLGNWSDGEILRAMREGVAKDGRNLHPQMPYTTYAKAMSDDDALAVIAYLRTLAPVDNDPGITTIDFPVSMFMRGVPQPLTEPAPPAPPVSDKLARGNWLLTVCSCHDCHDVFNERHEPQGKPLGGGFKFPLPNDKGTAIAPNISSDKATGIGAYSDDDIRRVFNEGKNKSGRYLYTMPWSYYGGMTPEDKEALIVALRAQPAVSNLVPPSEIK